MDAAQVASRYSQRQAALSRQVANEAATLWARLDAANLDSSFAAILSRLLALVSGGMTVAASQADGYLTDVLTAQSISPAASAAVNAAAFGASATDGRALDSLLREPLIGVKSAIGAGSTVDRAMAGGLLQLDMIVRTQVADAGRTAVGAGLTARENAQGYVRLVSAGACSRCIVLAGKFYRWNRGFLRHPNCFPAGVVVSGPGTLAATKRIYQGELVVIRTADGQELPVTGNHPILTNRGWVPANLLQEGDHVVRSTRGQGASALVVPGEDQMPSRIEDCWRPDGVVPLLHVPTTTEDFHGDGGHGDVDVVLANRLLRNSLQSSPGELTDEEELARRVAQAIRFNHSGAMQELLVGALAATGGLVGGGGLRGALLRSHPMDPDLLRERCTPHRHPATFEAGTDHGSGYPIAPSQAELALARQVCSGNSIDSKILVSARWDAPAGPFTVESSVAYAGVGKDLLIRLASQVELHRVVELRRAEWSGHVYNLTSVEGWYSANGFIVSNCDCRNIPSAENRPGDIRTDPNAYFKSLSKDEQDRRFTRAGAQAIRDGSDIGQVVNSQRGMYTAGGRKYTRESTSRSGVAPKRQRLTPEQIYADADGDRGKAIALLKSNGYLYEPLTKTAVPKVSSALQGRFATAAFGKAARDAATLSRLRTRQALSNAELRALYDYTGFTYGEVNGPLRARLGSLRAIADAEIRSQIRLMDAALSRSPLTSDVVVYRGIGNGSRVFGPDWDGDLTGAQWVEHAYLSTSSSATQAGFFGSSGGAQMRILAPRGTRGIELTGDDAEAELLLQRGLRLRIVRDSGPGSQPRVLDVEIIR